MDIREAKEQIARCVRIYLKKDSYGNYRIPVERQRPVFLLGAPGIGKTAIMEQISRETGLPLLSYSMTHHTRQSALGLPVIVDRSYQGKTYSVSEYTLSEIISSIYACMERTGVKEGILFLDEINCVSETLAPSMLQFLQYKTFGNHRIPDGWVIVTAGNPPQYNRAVREFDIVTLDRLKVREIRPDYRAWRIYAREAGIHRSIQTFLDIRRDHFYHIETGREGRQYVTARGWEDLSEAIYLYEENDYPVDEGLITQYIRHQRIADEFSTYYMLYSKYRGDYQIRRILAGEEMPEMVSRAAAAGLDERVSVLELLLEALLPLIREFMDQEAGLVQLRELLADIRDREGGLRDQMAQEAERLTQEALKKEAAGLLSAREKAAGQFTVSFLREEAARLWLEKEEQGTSGFSQVSTAYRLLVEEHGRQQLVIDSQLSALFAFVEKSWAGGNEMLILMTELAAEPSCSGYLFTYGSEPYDRYSSLLRLSDRKQELDQEIAEYMKQ